jgi:hypothetical protein
MSADLNNVVYLHRRVPQEALERLNRVTGLQFSNWPESLVSTASHKKAPQSQTAAHIPEWCAG